MKGAQRLLTVLTATALSAGCAGGGGLAPRRAPDSAGTAAFSAGEIRTLDNPGFAPAEAGKGLWRPQAALESGRWGIYFLEPYEPGRIPVLFVHGIGGTPRDFRAMIGALDRTRFQAWVLQYPSGLRLPIAARALRDNLAQLRREYRFDALFIAAHSMGGLVSRRYLVETAHDGDDGFSRLLVTFSTPWEGNAWAQTGARLMPGSPESWADLRPQCGYLASLYTPLAHVPHYIFFSYRRGRSLLTSQSSDGTIALSSQLPAWVQDQAEHSWGYDTDHVGILSDPAALARFNSLLASEADRLHSGRLPIAGRR